MQLLRKVCMNFTELIPFLCVCVLFLHKRKYILWQLQNYFLVVFLFLTFFSPLDGLWCWQTGGFTGSSISLPARLRFWCPQSISGLFVWFAAFLVIVIAIVTIISIFCKGVLFFVSVIDITAEPHQKNSFG